MSYIEKNLMNGENIVYRTKLHWIAFIWPVIWIFFAIIFYSSGSDVAPIGTLFILIAILTGIPALINFITSEFGITNKRVIVKVGFIRRNSVEVLLNKVEGIQVIQGILGRILGFGSIIVSGTGGTKDPFHKIDAPLEFRKKIQEQISTVQDFK
ncbi:MAG: PH domain-containing protein [Desulfobacter sp.]